MRKVHHVAIGKPKELAFSSKSKMMTGIEKTSVLEAQLTFQGFVGDGPFNMKHHGGPDRTVCVFPVEHYAYFEEKFQKKLPKSAFGENLMVSGMLEKDVAIGDIFQIGEAVIQVTEARNPCSTIGKYNHMPELYKEVQQTGFTGYLCRTIQEGKIQQLDEVILLEADAHQVTVAYCHEMVLHKKGAKADFERIAAVKALSERYYESLQKKLQNSSR
ncbi:MULTISPECIES: MOSC domain-containing protein [unclassified Listeria]|uniref:MOSC domain-containing protein n=1 Tax=unclassified Listeria TaxID=2642072 RepID=UPI000B589053|nr:MULTISPECIES: MOSC domain-containing protein [unclassified Listeria]